MTKAVALCGVLAIGGCAKTDTGTSSTMPILRTHNNPYEVEPDTIPDGEVSEMVVLQPGDVLKAENQYGRVVLTATGRYRRKLEVQRVGERMQTFDLELGPRDGAFRGLTGIYTGRHYMPDPAEVSLQEGQLFLRSIADVKKRLAEAPGYGYVISPTGLVVGIFNPKYAPRVTVDVFQLMVDHKPPAWDGGSSAIEVIRGGATASGK